MRQDISDNDTITHYYDDLAPYYHLILQDWQTSLRRHATLLDTVIREHVGASACTVLDAACGTGMQSIGLAELGYQVTASDISSAELAQAEEETQRRNLAISFHLADMRQVWTIFQRQFDIVLAFGNAVPHLLNEADILLAFQQFRRCIAPGGACIISVRDYAAMERSGQRMFPRQVHATPEGRDVLFDLWQFDGDYYDFTTYIVHDTGQPEATTRVIHGGRYYCVTVEALERLFIQAGFQEVIVDRERFFQPMLIAR
ncbi:MAG TPA: class I SAM-dependent methyltransferase [Armatimonadota bacterium]|nr:class I SAM-dependent methyltransferase [Armatimonadota bacterium]